MTIKDFIKILEKFPADAIIGIKDVNTSTMYEELDKFSVKYERKENEVLISVCAQEYSD